MLQSQSLKRLNFKYFSKILKQKRIKNGIKRILRTNETHHYSKIVVSRTNETYRYHYAKCLKTGNLPLTFSVAFVVLISKRQKSVRWKDFYVSHWSFDRLVATLGSKLLFSIWEPFFGLQVSGDGPFSVSSALGPVILPLPSYSSHHLSSTSDVSRI